MKWRGRQRSRNIEDRRSAGFSRGTGGMQRMRIPTGRAGSSLGGVGFLLVIVILAMAFGVNPLALLGESGTSGSVGPSEPQPMPNASEDELADFVSVVVNETEILWTQKFDEFGMTYEPPVVVLFSGNTQTTCGLADARTGPFYCPGDRKVYIDLSFYEQLRAQFGAPGDFAQAYVLAHEIGHHVQQLTGTLPEFNQARQTMSEAEANQYSVRVELQADCYAGIWANYAGQEDLLDRGDAEEALNAASQIGDDTLQRRMQGFAVPKSFNHGTSAQRRTWFERGLATGDPTVCDTFSVARP